MQKLITSNKLKMQHINKQGKHLEGIDLEEWMAGDGFAKYAIARDKANKKPTLFQRFMTWLKDLVGFAHKNA